MTVTVTNDWLIDDEALVELSLCMGMACAYIPYLVALGNPFININRR